MFIYAHIPCVLGENCAHTVFTWLCHGYGTAIHSHTFGTWRKSYADCFMWFCHVNGARIHTHMPCALEENCTVTVLHYCAVDMVQICTHIPWPLGGSRTQTVLCDYAKWVCVHVRTLLCTLLCILLSRPPLSALLSDTSFMPAIATNSLFTSKEQIRGTFCRK